MLGCGHVTSGGTVHPPRFLKRVSVSVCVCVCLLFSDDHYDISLKRRLIGRPVCHLSTVSPLSVCHFVCLSPSSFFYHFNFLLHLFLSSEPLLFHFVPPSLSNKVSRLFSKHRYIFFTFFLRSLKDHIRVNFF